MRTGNAESVFGHREAHRVLTRERDFGDDGLSSDFFADALSADAFLRAGVAAFTNGDELAVVKVVEFSGDLAGDEAARAAFILRGPNGVRRIA
jgi:hypothetical protein